ncbi:MAG: hypothetical protein EPN51_23370 [Mycobacterium sp.]|nr:MAG: hypothetical protein EPN51_23370 [Mycobacterium sp.]
MFPAIATRAELTRAAINHDFTTKSVLYREVPNDTKKFVIGASIKQMRPGWRRS